MRTSWRGAARPPPRSALVPTRGSKEGRGRSEHPASLGAAEQGSQGSKLGSRAELLEETEDREPKGRPGTPAVAADPSGRRDWPQEGGLRSDNGNRRAKNEEPRDQRSL